MAGRDDLGPPPPHEPLHDDRESRSGSRPELQRALGDLESAMRRLAGTAQRELSDRAIDAIDGATHRIRRAERRRDRRERRAWRRFGHPGDARGDGWHEGQDAGIGSGVRYRTRSRRRRMFRVPSEGVIAGVCAGMARRLGLETWVVRCLAVTGLLFIPQIVFPGYWVLCWVMRPVTPEQADVVFATAGAAGRAPIAGFDRAARSPDRLRRVRDTLDALETRVRRMEGYVTSNRFLLDRELSELDK